MPTEAQLIANHQNAAASTGPRTPEGKSRVARNAITFGLFSQHDIVNPGEEEEHAEFAAAIQRTLAPDGPIEQTLAAEIARCAWRLRRCSLIESGLATETAPDPMANPEAAATLAAIDRARVQSHRLLHKSMAELRRLQTERRVRVETLPADFDTSLLGLAGYKEIVPVLAAEARWKLTNRKLAELDTVHSIIDASMPPKIMPPKITPPKIDIPQPQPRPLPTPTLEPQTPRNAPCPCGSGDKFKRCCGRNAPAVLGRAA